MLPSPPASPAHLPKAKRRMAREHSLAMLRNNIVAVFAILFFNWFFAIYPRVEVFLVPAPWLRTVHIIELVLLCVIFGSNILVALISLCYPRPPFSDPALKPPSTSPTRATPVRRPVKNLGRSKYASTSVSSLPGNYSINSPLRSHLSFSQSAALSSSSIGSVNSLPLAAYRSRYPRRPSEPIGTGTLQNIVAGNAKTTSEILSISS